MTDNKKNSGIKTADKLDGETVPAMSPGGCLAADTGGRTAADTGGRLVADTNGRTVSNPSGHPAMDIVGIGTPTMDLLINLPYFPVDEGGMRLNEIFHQGGGNCASAMVTAARLGAKVGMIAKVGRDAAGDFIINDFIFNGVDTSYIIRGRADTTSPYCVAVSETDKGTRKFLMRSSDCGRLTPRDIPYEYIKTAKILHIEAGGDAATLAGAKFAKENGVTVSIDAGYYSKKSESLLPYVDIFIASEYFYSGMFPDSNGPESYEKNFQEIMKIGPSVVWLTLGDKGCIGLADGAMHEIPSFKVPVKDTTGAGDDFHGAYIAIMLEGLSHYECARHASAVAAIKCMFVGGRTGLPDRAMLKRYLDEGVLPTEELEERLKYYRNIFLK